MPNLHRGTSLVLNSNFKLKVAVGISGAILLQLFSGCDAADVAQLENAIQVVSPAVTVTANPSPSPSPSPLSGLSSVPSVGVENFTGGYSGATCYYMATYTYDLGPGIDVTQSFEVIGSSRHPVEVTELVTQSVATGCPEGVMVPAAGDSQAQQVYAVVSESGEVSLYPTAYSQPTLLTVSSASNASALVAATTFQLSMTPSQVSNGRETQIFESGTLQSAQGGSDALMQIQVTYVYAVSQSLSSGNSGLHPN